MMQLQSLQLSKMKYCFLLINFLLFFTSRKNHFVLSADVPVVTWEELSTKTGKDGSDIWLSIFGEVYDVTAGKEHYEPGTAYNAFAGNDSSVPYVTGTFTAEEAQKSPIILDKKSLKGLLSWVKFYRETEKYIFKGYLVDPRYYDENGNPTDEMELLLAKAASIEKEEELKKKEPKKEPKKEL